MVLLRHLIGDALRRLRLRQGRTLREVSASARVSLGYLSEVERGQKEASSELLAAICAALQTPLSQVLREVSDNFALAELQSEPVFAGVMQPSIEVTIAHDGKPQPGQVPAGAAAQAGGRVQMVSGARRPMTAGPGAGARRMSVPATTSRLPLGPAALPLAEPAYDRVARTAREITSMVPV